MLLKLLIGLAVFIFIQLYAIAFGYIELETFGKQSIYLLILLLQLVGVGAGVANFKEINSFLEGLQKENKKL